MPSFVTSRGDQDSEPTSIDVTEDESTSDFSAEPESDEKEEAKEDELKLEQFQLSPVIKTSAKAKVKAKVKKKSWWRRAWSKNFRKKRKKKQRKKKKKKSKRKKRKGRHTVSMHRHHHATFAHLIHDALLRLKCSPIHHSGYSHKRILKNIEQHYRLKLGKKFKVRLQLSFERLVKKSMLVSIGSKKTGFKYKPSVAFLKKFSRLKVIDGAANRRFGVEILKYKRSSRNRSRSHRRMRRRRRRRKRKRRKKKKKRRGRRRRKPQSRSQSHSSRKGHSGKTTKSKKGTSSKFFGGSIANWFWPSKENKVEGEKNTKSTLSEEKNSYSNLLKRLKLKRKHKSGRGSYGRAKGARYRRFHKLRIRERAEKPVFFTPKGSFHSATTGVLDPIENSHYETPPTSMSEDDDEETRSTTSRYYTPMASHKSRKEHDILHALKEGSKGYSSKRSFLEKVGDTLRGAFGSEHTSTTTCEGGPSKPPNFSKTPSIS